MDTLGLLRIWVLENLSERGGDLLVKPVEPYKWYLGVEGCKKCLPLKMKFTLAFSMPEKRSTQILVQTSDWKIGFLVEV